MKDMYNTYDTQCFVRMFPCEKDDKINITWNYGDYVHINIDPLMFPPFEFVLTNYKLNIYNFRMELVNTFDIDNFIAIIDNETSKELFPKGIYYGEVKADSSEGTLTLVESTKFNIYVR